MSDDSIRGDRCRIPSDDQILPDCIGFYRIVIFSAHSPPTQNDPSGDTKSRDLMCFVCGWAGIVVLGWDVEVKRTLVGYARRNTPL